MDDQLVWTRPVTTTHDNILYWEPKILAHPPIVHDKPFVQEDYDHYKTEAKKLFRVPDHELGSWEWVCRLYMRAPTGDSPEKGKKMRVQWITSTAWLVRGAHKAGQTGQWLMTAAHNISSPVYEHDDQGVITGYKTAQALADAIYIEAGWGAQKFGGWVDRVSMMKGFIDDVSNIHLDGAALHIVASSIPANAWEQAPLTTTLSESITVPFVVAGFPGEINEYADLKGFYITGHHEPPEGPVKSAADFKDVSLIPGPINLKNSGIVVKFSKVPSPEGFSGGPLIVGSGKNQQIIGLIHTDGTGALLVGKNPGVDIVHLIEIIGGTITTST